jgi:hypothetical protein
VEKGRMWRRSRIREENVEKEQDKGGECGEGAG